MKTDELILQLARSAGPVTPLARPSVRLWRWGAMALALAAITVVAVGPRADLSAAMTRPAFLVSLLALTVATVSAAGAALAMSVPGAERSLRRRTLALTACAAWPIAWLVTMAMGVPGHAPLVHVGCALEITLLAAASGSSLLVMLRRAAPLQPIWTAGAAAIAAVGVASAATQVICPIDDAAHQLVGHVAIAAVVGLVGFAVGQGWLAAGLLGLRRQ